MEPEELADPEPVEDVPLEVPEPDPEDVELVPLPLVEEVVGAVELAMWPPPQPEVMRNPSERTAKMQAKRIMGAPFQLNGAGNIPGDLPLGRQSSQPCCHT